MVRRTHQRRPMVRVATDSPRDLALELDPAQQLRVRGDDDGARRHEDRTDGWGEEDPLRGKDSSSEGDGDDVVARGPEEVLDHLRVRRPRETDDLDDAARIVS